MPDSQSDSRPDRPSGSARDLDVVLLGATGFVGRLTAQHLAAHAPADVRWAVAARSEAALQRLVADLADHPSPPVASVVVDVTDTTSLDALAARTRVLATTVGPYLKYGDAVVGACARAGTDYLDLTGEAEFVDRSWTAHHATAVESGARLVHACGFDSVPHDLGAQFTVEQLPSDVPLTVRGVVRSSAAFSGGTYASALNAMGRMGEAREAARARRAVEQRPEGRTSRATAPRPHRDPDLGYWLLPLPTVDPVIVARSGAALADYGPRFTYSHFAGIRTLKRAVLGGVAVAGLATAAKVPPLRRQLEKRVPAGSGPSAEKRARSWFTVDFIGEGGGQRVHTRVSGGDPGYDETAVMLGEAALCLLRDDNPETAGQVTTAVAMGPRLRERLERHGMRFEVIDS
ncbi:saccharopine dehydrogenase NADP-binding domain-containing protein [Nocardioides sp. Y6]|uniref:Saccharopine dehydrogenase NADP-binding domain-containing protein n=1 Tax=Nocardioides malaquae TaxID=2773426 RepID=A0ABR9RUS6_9ACTN|nr:saccharopine dehydrogenase NADP-binding domain-containing protein [Nocardioides malaquae]MBE7325357.1 saccharopine dehydrogenase NADP-binding domain-containing protein [Nocardioides malaquae]